jgi:hypothetical protein
VIIKSLSRKSNSNQLIKYILRYTLDEEKVIANRHDKHETPFIIRHNVRSRSLKGFIKEFEENESYRLVHRKDSVKLFHTIISFSSKDSSLVTDKLLKDIAKKYISERGLNNLYVGARHSDRDHVHIHLAVSGVQLNGRSSRISKQQFHHIKLELDRYQKEKFPQLVHSLPQHGFKKRQLAKQEVLKIVKQNRETKKESLCEALKTAYDKSTSKEQFVKELTELGYDPYYRNEKLQGVLYDGQKFRLGRLGYDEVMLDQLNQQQHKEEKTMQELEALRNDHLPELEPSLPPVNNEAAVINEEAAVVNEMETEEQLMLDELTLLRTIDEGRIRLNENPMGEERFRDEFALDDLRRNAREMEHELEDLR